MEGKWAVCTIAAKRHLALGRVVCSSFRRHHADVAEYLLLADEVDGYFVPAAEPFQMVTLDALGDPAIDRMRERYSQQEFSYALTPFLMNWVFQQGMERVLFLKQEPLVTGDLRRRTKITSHCMHRSLWRGHSCLPRPDSSGRGRVRLRATSLAVKLFLCSA